MLLPSLLLLQAVSGPLTSALPRPNVLIVLADDLGVDQLACYGEGAKFPATPHLDQLADEGVLFRNAWATPWCSPTRATLMTGRYGFRTGMGIYMQQGDDTGHALPLSEITLPEMLDAGGSGYAHAAFGKWHLGNATVGGYGAPNAAGWSHYSGGLNNFKGPYDYEHWPKTIDGHTFLETTYATTDTVDSFLAWAAETPEPWCAYVAFHAIHTPLHAPPAELHSTVLTSAHPHFNPRPFYMAAAEALDTEFGRLRAGLGASFDRTHVIFLGDNGSPADAVLGAESSHQHKGTFYEGGLGVPLIVRGPAVQQPGTECSALVHSADVYGTVAELAGVDLGASLPADHVVDSVSLVPYLANPRAPAVRSTVYSESFEPNGFDTPISGFRAIRGARYKLVRDLTLPERLYDLELDPRELNDLLLSPQVDPEALAAYQALAAELDALAH